MEPQRDRSSGISVNSQQDGEDPVRRTDFLSERNRPGLHGGAGDTAWNPDKPLRKPPEPKG